MRKNFISWFAGPKISFVIKESRFLLMQSSYYLLSKINGKYNLNWP